MTLHTTSMCAAHTSAISPSPDSSVEVLKARNWGLMCTLDIGPALRLAEDAFAESCLHGVTTPTPEIFAPIPDESLSIDLSIDRSVGFPPGVLEE